MPEYDTDKLSLNLNGREYYFTPVPEGFIKFTQLGNNCVVTHNEEEGTYTHKVKFSNELVLTFTSFTNYYKELISSPGTITIDGIVIGDLSLEDAKTYLRGLESG